MICAALPSFVGHATGGQDEAATRSVTAPGAQVQINQIETSQFPKAVIFATVLKDGVTDKDVRVREDEVDQEPLMVVPNLTPLSVVLALDTSGSMKQRLTDAQTAAKSFLTTLQSQDKVQVIRFSRDVKTIYPLGVDRMAAKAAIDSTVAGGDTALWDALYARRSKRSAMWPGVYLSFCSATAWTMMAPGGR
ncbi:MAG: vWA domain-containing protein [Gammaproteobacteria bacterium]